MAGLLDDRKCWPNGTRRLNRWLNRPGVKAARNNGHRQLLDPEAIPLLILRDTAQVVSRAVSRRVPLLPDVMRAIVVVDRAVKDGVAHLDNEQRCSPHRASTLSNTPSSRHWRIARGLRQRLMFQFMCLLVNCPLEALLNCRPWSRYQGLQFVQGIAAELESLTLADRHVPCL